MKKIITVIATSLCFAFVVGATDVPKTEMCSSVTALFA